MKLNEEQKNIIEPKIINKRCPMCGSKKLMFNETPAQVMFYPYLEADGSNIDFQRPGWINVLHGECKDCGYIILFRLDTLLGTRNQK